jgi:hypothetical protein
MSERLLSKRERESGGERDRREIRGRKGASGREGREEREIWRKRERENMSD